MRSCSQIMSRAQKKKEKDDIASLPFHSKTQATLNKKTFVNLYAEDLYFLKMLAGWKVTKIYEHYTFKQDTFKKDFVVMNQNARKTAKTKVEKDFYKLLNSNFGNYCRNNIGNCKLNLLYDGLDEISYIKKFTNIFNYDRFSEFFSVDLLKEQIISEYNEKMENLDQDGLLYFSIKENIGQKYEEDLEAVGLLKKKKKRKFNNLPVIDSIEKKIKNCEDIRKNKMIIEFNDHKSSAVKLISVKNESVIKCTTRFMSGKLLMLAKLSLKSFIYTLVELLHFPEENPIVAAIYKKYKIDEIRKF